MDALTKKLKGSTMVETMVAMVIVMISIGIGFSIFSNLSGDINDELYIKAQIQLKSWAVNTKVKKDFKDVEVEVDQLRLQRTFLNYKQSERLKVLMIEAFTLSGKKIGEHKEVVCTQ